MVLLLQGFIFKIGTAQEANHRFKPGAQNKHRTSTIYQHHKYILHVSNNKYKHNHITTGYTFLYMQFNVKHQLDAHPKSNTN